MSLIMSNVEGSVFVRMPRDDIKKTVLRTADGKSVKQNGKRR
jgi:hypothetical protein